jgi:hypothetical protein
MRKGELPILKELEQHRVLADLGEGSAGAKESSDPDGTRRDDRTAADLTIIQLNRVLIKAAGSAIEKVCDEEERQVLQIIQLDSLPPV